MDLPIFDLSTASGREALAARVSRLKATASSTGEAAATVARILEDVRREGDAAVVRYMQKWTDPQFSAEMLRVTPEQLDRAEAKLPPELRHALERAIANVRAYQQHIMPAPPPPVTIGGAELGLRFTSMDSAGLIVPGGKAAYPSSVIMLAIPALVAGVPAERLAIMTPPPTRAAGAPAADIPDLVLATCKLVGVQNVYRMGGAQGVAALALGTQSVQPVDMLAGPGNIFVQLAKAQLAGTVGIDGFYGPSEIVTIADTSARPGCIAADLLAQAEHDPGKCFLVSWSRPVLDAVLAEVTRRLADQPRRDAIERALADESAFILVADRDEAAAVANTLACEHLNLAVQDPDALLNQIRHAGEAFLGDGTPVAAGDYWAGPSHCLPTGTTARFASGISVYSFLKRTGTVAYRNGMPAEAIDAIARLADAEGLPAHAASVRARG